MSRNVSGMVGIKNLFNLLFFVSVLAIAACLPDDDPISGGDVRLEFSRDTIRFDTVFTQLGSATRILKLYNNNDGLVEISSIRLRNNQNGRFRLNIDGDPVNEATEVRIPANDSLYVFAEVTVNPDQDVSVSPFVIEDFIDFETNGNAQSVVLEAWGQNAIYLPNQFANGAIAVVEDCNAPFVFDDPKPYVIFGIVVFDNCDVVMEAGTKIYVHGGLGRFRDYDADLMDSITQFYNDGRIVIGPSSSLRINGTVDEPVVIQGDRLEPVFEDIAGQWFGILINENSKGNKIENAVIKNSVIGLVVDSAATLDMVNTQILNTASNGILGVHSSVNMENCLLANNAAGAARFLYGGNYNIRYSSLATYGVQSPAISLSNALCLDQLCSEYVFFPLRASLDNSILFGSARDAISLSPVPETLFDYNFDHCIVKVDQLDDEERFPDFFDHCDNCINATRDSVIFVDPDEGMYQLDTLSIAEMEATPISDIRQDILGVDRDPQNPDIGCYEYVPGG